MSDDDAVVIHQQAGNPQYQPSVYPQVPSQSFGQQPAYGQPTYAQPAYPQQPQQQQYQQGQPTYHQPQQYAQPQQQQPTYHQPQQYAQPQYQPPHSVKGEEDDQPPRDPEKPQEHHLDFSSGEYRDKIWILIFGVHLILILVVCGVYGSRFVTDLNNEDQNPPPSSGDSLTAKQQKTIVGILVASAIVACVFGAVWLAILKRYADKMIIFSMVAVSVFLFIGMIVSFSAGQV